MASRCTRAISTLIRALAEKRGRSKSHRECVRLYSSQKPAPLFSATGHLTTSPGVSMSQAESFKSDEHEFSPNRSRDVVNSAANFASQTPEERMENPESTEQESMAEYGGAPVSLSSVMQTNVPEPFRATGRSPTHLNMPGGAAMRDSKYVSDRQQAAYASHTPPLFSSFGYKKR